MIINIALSVILLIGGFIGGEYLTALTAHGDSSEIPSTAADDGHGKSSGGHGSSSGGHGEAKNTNTASVSFIKFSRQFIVPVWENDKLRSMLVIDILLEVPTANAEKIFAMEPKVRDALLRNLMLMSAQGFFDRNFGHFDIQNYIRDQLRKTVFKVTNNLVNDILIIDMIKQET